MMSNQRDHSHKYRSILLRGVPTVGFQAFDRVRWSCVIETTHRTVVTPGSVRFKPGSHRKIVKDYRPKTGKDQEILSESG